MLNGHPMYIHVYGGIIVCVLLCWGVAHANEAEDPIRYWGLTQSPQILDNVLSLQAVREGGNVGEMVWMRRTLTTAVSPAVPQTRQHTGSKLLVWGKRSVLSHRPQPHAVRLTWTRECAQVCRQAGGEKCSTHIVKCHSGKPWCTRTSQVHGLI